VLLSAHLKVLSVLSGQGDLITGLVSNGRPEVDDGDKVLGLFLNTLPFRQRIAGGTWLELVRATFENELEVTRFRRFPLAQLQKEHGGRPLFETAFNFLHFHVYDALVEFDGLEVLDTHLVSKVNFPLLVHFALELKTSDVELILEWDPREFRKREIARIGDYYLRVLEVMGSAPSLRHDVDCWLSTTEQWQVLVEWNDTKANFGESCIHRLFEEQVVRSPEEIAVVFGDRQISYDELNRRANKLGHYLQGLGVGPDVSVGICIERGPELAIGVLGILKAGGAYLPLDPTYPPDRLDFMLADGQARVLVTQQGLRRHLAASSAEVVSLDRDWLAVALERDDNPAGEVESDNIAYVIYTSGSTGRPKGVAMQHQPLVNLIEFQHYQFQLGESARTLQFSSLSFDASFNEMFSSWRAGGTVIMMRDELRRDPEALLRLMSEQMVERVFLPFTAFQQLADSFCRIGVVPSGLRAVLSTAEQLQVNRSITQMFGRLPSCALYNEYGPSETHVVTTHTLSGSPDHWPALPSIGRPIANAQTYVVDHSLSPVPVPVPGELYLGGAALARGYLNCPEATAERFVPDPFSPDHPGARLYRTGDLATYLPDGNIEFLGRIDHQLKLRGYRIEAGEIEAVLRTHASVRDAVVRLKESPPGRKRLVAYVVPQMKQELNVDELRELVKRRVPPYMVPNAYVKLNALPLTPSGKVDFKSLPLPDNDRPVLSGPYVAPSTPLELLLVRVWAEVISVEKVGVDDNFFDVGGDSLLSMRVHGRLCEELGKNIPIIKLFEYPTIRSLACFLRNEEAAEPANRQNRIWAEERKQALRRQRREAKKRHEQHRAF